MKLTKKLNLVIGLSLLTVSASQAVLTLADGVTVDAGSEFFPAANLNVTTSMDLGGDGLTSDDLFTTTAKLGLNNAWVTNNNGVTNSYFAGGGEAALTFTFDIALTRVQSMTIWSYPHTAPGNGVSEGTVEFFNGATSLGTEILAIGIGYDTDAEAFLPGSVQTFGSNYDDVTSAKVIFTANYAAGNIGGDRAGAGTVAFNVVEVPEPSSAALLGLGGLALILRRRK